MCSVQIWLTVRLSLNRYLSRSTQWMHRHGGLLCLRVPEWILWSWRSSVWRRRWMRRAPVWLQFTWSGLRCRGEHHYYAFTLPVLSKPHFLVSKHSLGYIVPQALYTCRSLTRSPENDIWSCSLNNLCCLRFLFLLNQSIHRMRPADIQGGITSHPHWVV